MRQRNTSGSPLHIPDIPALVRHGEEVEWEEALAGFEPVDDPPPRSEKPKPAASSATPVARDDEGAGK